MSGIETTFGVVEIPQAPSKNKPLPPENAEPKKLSRYMRNKLEAQKLAEHTQAKRKARRIAKTGSKPGGKLSKKALKVAEHKNAVKQILKKDKPEPEKGNKPMYGTCSFCGKPLTRPSSVAQGMGDFCAHNKGLLPAGVTREDHIATMTVLEEPKDSIKLRDAFEAARKAGYSAHRLMQAAGGNGGLRKPLNEHFQLTFYKNVRYLPKSVLKHFKDLEKR